jgi:membrane protease subunit HflK
LRRGRADLAGLGFFIVQEGQQAVITQFGKYKSTVGGLQLAPAYPFQRMSWCA